MEIYDETRDYTLEELETLRAALLIMAKDPDLSDDDNEDIAWDVRDIDREIREITGEELPPVEFHEFDIKVLSLPPEIVLEMPTIDGPGWSEYGVINSNGEIKRS